MIHRPAPADYDDASVEVHLLGVVDYDECLALQNRLVYEISAREDQQITVLLCEHPAHVTIGRQGSRMHIRLNERQLAARSVDVRWVNRGGGCIAHAPGQLAVYPLVPLERLGFSVGEYMRRLQSAVVSTLADVKFSDVERGGAFGAWGRTGQIAALGVSVRNWVTFHGAFINVSPAMDLMRYIESDPKERTTMSSLMAERRPPVKMTAVRESLARRLTEAFSRRRFHLYAGHPLIDRIRTPNDRERVERVG